MDEYMVDKLIQEAAYSTCGSPLLPPGDAPSSGTSRLCWKHASDANFDKFFKSKGGTMDSNGIYRQQANRGSKIRLTVS